MGNIVGGIVGGLLGKGSGSREADAIRESGQQAVAQLEPFIEPGAQANQNVLAALGFGDPTEVQGAFDNFLGSTGFQAELDAGSRAITGNRAARGLLNSGGTLKALQQFGQDLGAQRFQNFIGNLGSVANRGVGAAGSAASAITGTGRNAAAARARGDNAFNEGIGRAVGFGFNALGL